MLVYQRVTPMIPHFYFYGPYGMIAAVIEFQF